MKNSLLQIFDDYLGKLPLGVMLIDKDGHILKTNNFVKAFAKQFSYPVPTNIYVDAMPMHDPIDKEHFYRAYSEILETNQPKTLVMQGNGFEDVMSSKVTLTPAPSVETGIVEGCLATFELCNVESPETSIPVQLESNNELRDINGRISHEFKNILAIISANLETLEEIFSDMQQGHPFIERSVSACQRGIELANSITRASGDFNSENKLIDVNLLMFTSMGYWSVLLGKEIKLKSDLDAHQITCMADSENFKAAMTNLLVNARDAIIESNVANPEVRISSRVISNEEGLHVARIVVSDNGPGIPDAMMDKVFFPFVTTKSSSTGTGLGLSITKNFIERMGGNLTLRNRNNKGLDAFIELPIKEDLLNKLEKIEHERTTAVRGLAFIQNDEKLAEFKKSAAPLINAACELFHAPMAAFSVFEEDIRHFIVEKGINQTQGSRTQSYCNHILWTEKPLLVKDSSHDPRISGHPMTERGMRFYASMPIRDSNDIVIGTLVCANKIPHEITEESKVAFEHIKNEVEDLVHLYEKQA